MKCDWLEFYALHMCIYLFKYIYNIYIITLHCIMSWYGLDRQLVLQLCNPINPIVSQMTPSQGISPLRWGLRGQCHVAISILSLIDLIHTYIFVDIDEEDRNFPPTFPFMAYSTPEHRSCTSVNSSFLK